MAIKNKTTDAPKRRKNQRKDGRIQIQVEAGRDPVTGKRIRKYFYGATLSEAQEKADEFRAKLHARIDLSRQGMSVREWGEEWLKTYKQSRSRATQDCYHVALVKINSIIGDMRMMDVRQIDLQQMLNTLPGYSSSYISKLILTLRQMFSAAYTNRIIMDNPVTGLIAPDGTSGTHRALDKWEIDLITAYWQGHRAGIWAMVMLYAGLRRGEAVGLQWDDVDLDGGILYVRRSTSLIGNQPVDGKTKTEAGVREVPIVPQLRSALHDCQNGCREKWVCLSAKNTQISDSALGKGWDGLLAYLSEEAKRDVSFRAHDLRHTFATMLYDAGVDVKTAQYMLGHKDPTMTMKIYTHLSHQRKKDSTKSMMDYFARL